MRHAIHHQGYRPVVFRDSSADYAFLSRSTQPTNKTITWTDGNEYPLIDLEISSASHPFFTGRQRFVDAAGRIEKFRRKFGTDYTQKQPKKKEKKQQESEWDDE